MKTQQKIMYHVLYSTGLLTIGFDIKDTAREMIECTSDLSTMRPVALLPNVFSVINGIAFSHN